MVGEFTINTLLQKGIDILGEGDYFNPLLDAQLLLCHVLNVDKLYIYTHKNDKIDVEYVDKFLNLIEKRKERYPLQYILGKQEFMGLDFYVEEGVLIPRPDTEILIEKVIEIVNEGYFKEKEVINIIDIGTGSGAISLSLVHYIKNAFVYSVDISDIPIKVASINAERLGLTDKIKFLKGDLFFPLKDLGLYNKIDIIVSNPPYIPSREISGLQKEVSEFEPRLALDGGEDGLYFYRKITDDSLDYLSNDGILAYEIGHDQGKEVEKLLSEKDIFKCTEIVKDLAGHDRVVIGYKK
ncbi:release factor glutamine methyltransferase PrmC [Gottschalkia purinilytica]|uniref:Release factor glutamine methyltransferase n=1 Tax=Gottschalkia purinilytica TaxID=1503 RepID=A0A0L0WE36_GOTPU|nr:peptide chain release factor N(5)-glutamine methyltransferase [Gottschalkia purinilytica]KNF09734.1 release factor glutamine methyltransferase PrmC [Gottschalkia purinilytica]